MSPQPVLIETALGVVECAVWGDGPAVVALHGAMGGYDQSVMLARAALAGGGFQFVAVSRPGYLGTPLAGAQHPEQQADLCEALLDALGIRQAAVLAVSGGGQCALQFALRHASRCWGLVLVSACTAPLLVELPLRFHLLKVMARLPWLTDMLRRKAARKPEESARRAITNAELCARTLGDPQAGPLLTELQLSTMEHLARRLPGTQNDIVESRRRFAYPVEQIELPVLLVHGTVDEVVPFADSRSLAARLPNAALLALEGGPHVGLFTHLHEIRERVWAFLHAHRPG
ncbi:alpha/beta fold hydrolase [Paludibaculum fermentans]|uniref:alpha/beta fold hydrolase n=1 Tax=Paludibaculum fermentans TaxID=1473598 RepID=UPI003EBA4773